jgi:DNA polymerase III delta subunit
MNDKARICWISGSFFHKRKIVDAVKNSLEDHKVLIYDDEYSAEYIEMKISGNELFSESRVVIIKDIPSFKGSAQKSNKKWKEVFSNIPEDCTVIVDGVDPNKKKVLYNHVKKIGKIFNPPAYLKRPEACSYVIDIFEKSGKHVEDSDVGLIVDNCESDKGNLFDVDRMIMYHDLICSFLGNKKKNMTRADIIKCLPNNSNVLTWAIFDLIDKRDYDGCQKLLYRSILSKNTAKEAVEGLFHQLSWRYRLLFFLKEQKISGLKDEDILKNLKELHRFSREGSGEYSIFTTDGKPLYSEKIGFNALKGFYGKTPVIDLYSRTELFKSMKVLDECLLKIRNSNDKVECLMMADNFFMFICNIMDDKELSRLRRMSDE